MSVDALVGAIQAEAEAEAARLLADAEAAAAARVEAAETAARERVAEALARAELAIGGAETRALNTARLALSADRTASLAARVEAAYALAERRLAAIGDGDAERRRWEAAVARLAAETAAITGPGELRVRARDLGAIGGLADRLTAASVDVTADPAMPPGVRGRSADGRLAVDATIPVRLRRARSGLQPEVAVLLHDGGTRGADHAERER